MQIEKIISKLYGIPCWGVRPGFGSFLTLEFGKPHLKVREPVVAGRSSPVSVRKRLARRRVYVHGTGAYGFIAAIGSYSRAIRESVIAQQK